VGRIENKGAESAPDALCVIAAEAGHAPDARPRLRTPGESTAHCSGDPRQNSSLAGQVFCFNPDHLNPLRIAFHSNLPSHICDRFQNDAGSSGQQALKSLHAAAPSYNALIGELQIELRLFSRSR